MKRYLLSGRMLANVLVLGLLGAWFLTLAPTTLSGPAAYIEVSGHSMDGTYKTGDLVVMREQDTYAKGDIVAFRVANGTGTGQVIHRIIGGNGRTGYTLQGDNNPDPDPWHPTDADVVGKAWVHFPDSAWVFDLPQNPTYVGLAAGLFTLVVLGWDARPRRRRDGEATTEEPASQLAGAAK
jgi:signal peptidase I